MPDIPAELIDGILSHLDPDDLKQCCLVSKQWFHLAKIHLYSDLYISNHNMDQENRNRRRDFFGRNPTLARAVRNVLVQLSASSTDPDDDEMDDADSDSGSDSEDFEPGQLDEIIHSGFELFAELSPCKLDTVHFMGLHFNELSPRAKGILRPIVISGLDNIRLTLRHLQFDGTWFPTFRDFRSLVLSFPNLNSLELLSVIWNPTTLMDIGDDPPLFTPLPQYQPRLYHLSVTWRDVEQGDELHEMLLSCFELSLRSYETQWDGQGVSDWEKGILKRTESSVKTFVVYVRPTALAASENGESSYHMAALLLLILPRCQRPDTVLPQPVPYPPFSWRLHCTRSGSVRLDNSSSRQLDFITHTPSAVHRCPSSRFSWAVSEPY